MDFLYTGITWDDPETGGYSVDPTGGGVEGGVVGLVCGQGDKYGREG